MSTLLIRWQRGRGLTSQTDDVDDVFPIMPRPAFYEELTPQERAIIKLHEPNEIYRYRWSYRTGQYRRVKVEFNNYWNKKAVAEAVGVTEREVERVIKKWNVYAWTPEKVIEFMLKFVREHKRWPNYQEFRQPAKHRIMKIESMHRVTSNQYRGYPAVQDIIARRKSIPFEVILTIPNVTIRRDAIQRYGFERLVKEKRAEKMAEDDFGILWRVPQRGDEDMVFVEVINSTPEPDGSFAHYFLRVPPDMETPHQAVAWSFGVPTEEEWKNFRIEVAT